MNPLVAGFIARFLQLGLAAVFGWFVQKGIFTDAEATTYISAAVAGLLALGWALWEKYKDRLKFMTAAASPRPVSEAQVEKMIASNQAPPANLPKDRVPYLEGQKPDVKY